MNKQKGITLIALVITIIVLLILAGVAISTLAGNDNILKNAETAVDKYNEKAEAEEAVLNTLEKKLIEYSNGGGTSTDTPAEPEPPTPPSVDASGLATAPYTIKPDENSNLQIVIPKGFAPAILKGATAENPIVTGPGEDGSVESIMLPNQWNNITTEQINKGIVVVDHAITYTNGVPDFNEYVWVPITGSEISTFARTAWNGPYWTSSYQGTGEQPIIDVSAEDKSNKYWEESNSTEYANMVNSINNNKGFYISRYEASNNGSDIAQSKRGQAPWISVSQTKAITSSVNNSIANTHLMYGIEWDSTLKWLIASGSKTENDIQTNSCSWGNYSNSTGDAATGKGSRKNTGYSEYWKANNIYDIAGNVSEWTQEKYSTGSDKAYRGGDHGDDGDHNPAVYRSNRGESNTYDWLRLSFQLLLVALCLL